VQLIHAFDNLLYQPAPAAFAGEQNSRGPPLGLLSGDARKSNVKVLSF